MCAQSVELCTGIAEVIFNVFFSGLIFTIAQVVLITAKIAFIFTYLSAVHIYDFHILTVITGIVTQSGD